MRLGSVGDKTDDRISPVNKPPSDTLAGAIAPWSLVRQSREPPA